MLYSCFEYFRNNLLYKTTVILTFASLITLVPLTQINAQEYYLPEWLKTNAEWWATGEISDEAYAKDIQWLLSNQLISEIQSSIKTDNTYVLSSDVPELQQSLEILNQESNILKNNSCLLLNKAFLVLKALLDPKAKMEGKAFLVQWDQLVKVFRQCQYYLVLVIVALVLQQRCM